MRNREVALKFHVVTRVLVLGGTGFVGPFIVRDLVERGDEVVLFHRGQREPALTEGAEHVHGEFERLPEYVAELAQRRPEVVVDVSPGLGKGGHGVLHFAGIVERGVVLTSMDVYRAMSVLWGVEGAGPPQPMPVTEHSELRSQPSADLTDDLAFDNLDVEQAVAGRPAFPVTVLRCPFIYGPLDPQRRLRAYVRRMADRRRAILLDARLARLRVSRGYVENVAQAAVAAVANERAGGRTYNVGEPDPLTEAEWARAIAAELGWEGQVVVAEPDALPPELQVPLPPQDIFADTSRIRDELGYAEAVSRADGLRRAIDWEREQQTDEPAPDYTSEDAVLGR
jgi:nucleoside-diphosphate-sugar epimerase